MVDLDRDLALAFQLQDKLNKADQDEVEIITERKKDIDKHTDLDFSIALQLQDELNEADQDEVEIITERKKDIDKHTDLDFAMALQLQDELATEKKPATVIHKRNVIDDSWELVDPNPDVYLLFQQFNQEFFWGKLGEVVLEWSKRMTVCAGVCYFSGNNFTREIRIRLSEPLLKLRPRKDLVETLLHEMIHAYLFVINQSDNRQEHGPNFREHMKRINETTGANVTVYHTFHDECNYYKTHVWQCDGPCRNKYPYYGIVRRQMNRAPSSNDRWFPAHQQTCGGTFHKVQSPQPQDLSQDELASPTARTSSPPPKKKAKKPRSDSILPFLNKAPSKTPLSSSSQQNAAISSSSHSGSKSQISSSFKDPSQAASIVLPKSDGGAKLGGKRAVTSSNSVREQRLKKFAGGAQC